MPPTQSVTRGDLIVAACDTRSRVALVTRAGKTTVTIVLVHAFPELATNADLIFPGTARRPWRAVAQGDLHGVVLPSQVQSVLDHLELSPCPPDANPTQGLPLAGPLDPRWAFKRAELDDLNALVEPFWDTYRD